MVACASRGSFRSVDFIIACSVGGCEGRLSWDPRHCYNARGAEAVEVRLMCRKRTKKSAGASSFVLRIGLALLLWVPAAAGFPRFAHHFVDRRLPGGGWGQTALGDIDRDGDLDFVTGRSGGEIRWYEFVSPDRWRPHLLGRNSPSDVGGALLDVDGDGRLDFVTGGAWYKQPKRPKDGPWKRIVFDPQLRRVHDVVIADLNGDGRPDVITMSDANDLRFYVIPRKNPEGLWKKRFIWSAVHAGLSAADIDGDGDIDIVRSRFALENLGKGAAWREHRFCGIKWAERRERSFYYHATRSCVADVNGDGRPDIVLTEAEFPGARIAWFEAPAGTWKCPWKAHLLPQGTGEVRGPYHSLQVADFDGDGDLDIFSGEMELYGVKPHRWYIWENRDRGARFVEHVILDKMLGTHETAAGDVDGDGDIDLVGKPWRAVRGNGNEGRAHVDFLENLLKK